MTKGIDTVLSKGMGVAKAVKATLSGLHGVFKTLAKQHGEVAALLERAKSSDEKFAELWPKIRMELLSHEKGEMRAVYPVLRAFPALRGMCDHHDTEAKNLEALIARIQELPGGSERRSLFSELVDIVIHHADEEETEIFPKAQDVIGKPEAENLDASFLKAKQQIADTV